MPSEPGNYNLRMKSFAIAFLALACSACTIPAKHPASPGVVGPNTVSFQVDGMACPNCAKHVAETLQAVPGVKSAQVTFETKTAVVELDPANPATMQALRNSVSAWHKEHFSQEEDPECLDPAKRKELQKQGG